MGTININGNTFTGSNISIVNDRVIIDGKTQVSNINMNQTLHIEVIGNIESLRADGSVTMNGDVEGNVDCGGSFKGNNVKGSVDCGGSCNCGQVGGDVDAGGSVSMKR